MHNRLLTLLLLLVAALTGLVGCAGQTSTVPTLVPQGQAALLFFYTDN